MKKILLTGFEAFAGNLSNPTHELMIEMEKRGYQTQVLPVSFTQAWKELEVVIQKEKPQWMISCGVAANRETIDFERVALNFLDAGISDNDGNKPCEEVIAPEEPACFLSDLPLNQWKERLAKDYPVKVSLSAGSYVCNYLYYQLMRHRSVHGYRALFIHFPYTSDALPLSRFVEFMQDFLSMLEGFDSE